MFHKIAESAAELFPGGEDGLTEVEVAGRTICVARVKGVLRACASQCPHAGASMSFGELDARGHIVCPLHRYRFSLENGRNVSGEGYFLKIFALEEREDGVFLHL